MYCVSASRESTLPTHKKMDQTLSMTGLMFSAALTPRVTTKACTCMCVCISHLGEEENLKDVYADNHISLSKYRSSGSPYSGQK